MSYSNLSPSSGLSFPSILTLIFIALKLCKVITWSWLWVLSPMWIVLSIYGIILIVILIIYLIQK